MAEMRAIPERPEWLRKFGLLTESNPTMGLLFGGLGDWANKVYWDEKPSYLDNVMAGLDIPLGGVAKAAAPVVAGGAGLLSMMKMGGKPRGLLARAYPSQVGAVGSKLPMDHASRMQRAKDMGFDVDKTWYHGANRIDRVLEKPGLNPKRATSGPMPFFTDDPNLASSYASGKADTSRLNDYDFDYRDWFKVKVGRGKSKNLDQAWYHLEPSEKQKIIDSIGKVTQNDDATSFYMANGPGGKHHWDRTLQEKRGNALSAAKDLWLDSGNLYDSEDEFLKVLKMGGLDKEVIFDSPRMTVPGVLPTYARINNPLDTSNKEALNEVLNHLKEAGKNKRYKTQGYGVDQWDKSSIGIREFTDRLNDDLANNTTHAWTSIPDDVTSILKSIGYDSILDKGGKQGGVGHNVLIPFNPSQLRSINAKFDPENIFSPDLLAGIGAGGLGLGLLGSQLYPQDTYE